MDFLDPLARSGEHSQGARTNISSPTLVTSVT